MLDHLQTALTLICGRHRKRGHGVTSISDVVCDPRLVGLIQNTLDEVDVGCRVGVHFFTKSLSNERPEMVLILNMLLVDHLGGLCGEVSRIILDTSVVVKGQSSPKRRVPPESFDFNSRRIFSKGILIDRISIDEVEAAATFRRFRIRRRPSRSSAKISFEVFFTIVSFQIKINADVFFGHEYVVLIDWGDIAKSRVNAYPGFLRGSVRGRVLGFTPSEVFVKKRIQTLTQFDP